MRDHHTTRGTTADGVPYVITLHPDGTASGMLPGWQGNAYQAAPMSHAMARTLIESLPGARALEGESEFMATKARREHPLPRKPSAWETRMRERMGRRVG